MVFAPSTSEGRGFSKTLLLISDHLIGAAIDSRELIPRAKIRLAAAVFLPDFGGCFFKKSS